MVLLTMTPAMVRAVEYARQEEGSGGEHDGPTDLSPSYKQSVGAPISHEEVLELAKDVRRLKQDRNEDNLDAPSQALDQLLRGSRVYIEPSKPKPKPVWHPILVFYIT